MNKLDKEIKDIVYDAEMYVSPDVWDKVERRIQTNPEKPKYWMFFILLASLMPALHLYLFDNSGESKILLSTIADNNIEHDIVSNHLNSDELVYRNISAAHAKEKKSTNNSTLSSRSIDNKIISEIPIQDIEQKELLHNEVKSNIQGQSDPVYTNPIKSVPLRFGNIDELPLLEKLNTNLIESDIEHGDERPFIQRLFSASTKCPRFNRKLKGIYIWNDFTSAYSTLSLNAHGNDFDDYISLRNSSEKSAYSFSTSIGLGYLHTSGWFFEAGLSYDQINTQFQIIENNVIGTEQVIRIIKDENNEVVETFEETVSVIGHNEIKHRNTLEQIEFATAFGYEMPIKPGLNLGLKAGPVFNLHSSNSGRILDIDSNPFFFNDNDDINTNHFKNNLKIAYVLGAFVVKDFSDRISVNVGLSYKSYNNINYDPNLINQSFTKYGFSTGLKFRLF